jgi:hypothetical protein
MRLLTSLATSQLESMQAKRNPLAKPGGCSKGRTVPRVLPPTVLDTPCRVFQGPCNGHGYGWRRSKAVVKRCGGERLVHRQMWFLVHGPIPAGQYVLHRCDNPPCFRLDHLFLGTKEQNWQDMRAKGRARHGDGWPGPRVTHCVHGHEYTPENTIPATATHRRKCRTCSRRWGRRHP